MRVRHWVLSVNQDAVNPHLEKLSSSFIRPLPEVWSTTAGIFFLTGKGTEGLKEGYPDGIPGSYSSLDPRKTAAKIIAEPLVVHKLEPDKKKRDDKVLGLMREVGLDVQHVNRFPHEFSGDRDSVSMLPGRLP